MLVTQQLLWLQGQQRSGPEDGLDAFLAGLSAGTRSAAAHWHDGSRSSAAAAAGDDDDDLRILQMKGKIQRQMTV